MLLTETWLCPPANIDLERKFPHTMHKSLRPYTQHLLSYNREHVRYTLGQGQPMSTKDRGFRMVPPGGVVPDRCAPAAFLGHRGEMRRRIAEEQLRGEAAKFVCRSLGRYRFFQKYTTNILSKRLTVKGIKVCLVRGGGLLGCLLSWPSPGKTATCEQLPTRNLGCVYFKLNNIASDRKPKINTILLDKQYTRSVITPYGYSSPGWPEIRTRTMTELPSNPQA